MKPLKGAIRSSAWPLWMVLIIAQVILSVFLYDPVGSQTLRIVGWMVGVAAGLFGALPIITLRRKGGVPGAKDYTRTTVLVDSGVYGVVRHPQYLSFMLLSLFLILIAQHWLIAVMGMAAIALVYVGIVPQADRANVEKFGDAYERYRRKVPGVNVLAGFIRLLRRESKARETGPWQDEARAQRHVRWTRIRSRAACTPFAREIVESLAPLPGEATIVDLGTGPGLLPIALHKLWPQAKIIEVDSSSEMLKMARKHGQQAGMPGLETRLGKAEEIPVESSSVDLVVSRCSFHEWKNPLKGLSEIFRVLKPGGTLILKDYNRAWLPHWKHRLLGFLPPLKMLKFTLEEVVDLLGEAGFDEIKGGGRGLEWFVQAVKRDRASTSSMLNEARAEAAA